MNWLRRLFSKGRESSTQQANNQSAEFCSTVGPTEGAEVGNTVVRGPASEALPLNTKDYLNERQIRVFISSTFRDMHTERELLVKKVFPELRRLCSERFVTFTEVDLRWGITEEQKAEGKVLPICLEEVHRCRPYFISLLGERYGWIPDSVPQEVIDREPWLKEHVGRGTSVTELEILHGVLKNPEMSEQAFFFFRDPAYIKTLPVEVRREMVERPTPEEIGKLGEAEAERRTEERQKKLAVLKERIRKSGFPLVDPYANPEELAEAVRRQFTALIDKLYPKKFVPDPLDQEAMGHEAYAQSKLHAFVERPAHTAALDAFANAESTGQGLVVTGESGGGKTTLLAHWVGHWRKGHPSDFVFVHYFGATPQSASAPGFLRRLLGELKRRYAMKDAIPTEPDRLHEVLPLWLGRTVGRGRIVLVLDGLNLVEGDEPDKRLVFLPHYFSANVRVLASALPGPALETLRERIWTEHVLSPIDSKERNLMIAAFFRHYRKTLRPDLSEMLAGAPAAANPLFLRTLLEELRQFGSFEQLPRCVAQYLEARTPKELFLRVIRRWQEDFDGNQDLVRRTLCPFWASRKGLTESEWLELFASSGKAVSRQDWRPLFLAMLPHLAHRSGLYAFGHDYLRRAVEAEYLPSEGDRRGMHLELADYFEAQSEMGLRKAEEWPWQLHAAESWERLESCLTDRKLFVTLKNDHSEWELTSYWHAIRKQGIEMGTSYTKAFDRWLLEDSDSGENPVLFGQLCSFLVNNGCYSDAEPLLKRTMEISVRVLGPEHPHIATTLSHMSELYRAQGRYGEAEPLLKQGLAIYEKALGPVHPHVAADLHNLANVYFAQGRYSEAERLQKRALAILDKVIGPEHIEMASNLNSLGGIYRSQGRYGEAELLFKRSLAIFEKTLGPEHPDVAAGLSNLAESYVDQKNYDKAEPLQKRALAIRENVLGPEHADVAISLNNLAAIYVDHRRYGEAELLYKRSLAIWEKALGPEHPSVAAGLNNLAGIYVGQKSYGKAELLSKRSLAIWEKTLGPEHPSVAAGLTSLARIYQAQGRHAEAKPLCKRSLGIREKAFGPEHPDLANSLYTLANIWGQEGQHAEAEPLLRRSLAILEKTLGSEHPDVAMNLFGLAVTCGAQGRFAEAETLLKRSLAVCKKSLGPEHPAVAAVRQKLVECQFLGSLPPKRPFF